MKYLILLFVVSVLLSCSEFDSTKIDCNNDTECPNNHICYKSQCYICGLDEYFNDEKGKCVNYCEENTNLCSNEQTCIGGRVNVKTTSKDYRNTPAYQCECESGYVLMGKECKKDTKCPSISCDDNNPCSSKSDICDDGFCKKICINNRDCDVQIGETCSKGHCSVVDCSDNEICYNGGCFPKNECSLTNPEGECPTMGTEDKFICFNGQCVNEQSETTTLIDGGNECIFDKSDISEGHCKQGFICAKLNLFDDEDNKGICASYCDLRYNNCPDNAECLPFSMINDASMNYSSNSLYQNIGVCYLSNCRNDADCKNEGELCKYFTDKLSFCMPAGLREENFACRNENQQGCKDDLVCIDNSCVNLCDVNENDCLGNSTCLPAMGEYSGQFNRQIGACFKNCQLPQTDTEGLYYYIGRDFDCGTGLCVSLDTTQENGFCNISSCNSDSDCGSIDSLKCSFGENLIKSCKKIGTKTVDEKCNPAEDKPLNPQCGLDMACNPTDEKDMTKGKCLQFCIPKENIEQGSCQSNYKCFDFLKLNTVQEQTEMAPNTIGICQRDCVLEAGESTYNIAVNNSCNNSNGTCTRVFDNIGICSIDECSLNIDGTDNCEAGSKCSLNFLGTKTCKKEGTKTAGQTCENDGDCKNNMVCDIKDNEISGTCLELCKPNENPTSCISGTACKDIINLDESNPYKFEKDIIGICSPVK